MARVIAYGKFKTFLTSTLLRGVSFSLRYTSISFSLIEVVASLKVLEFFGVLCNSPLTLMAMMILSKQCLLVIKWKKSSVH